MVYTFTLSAPTEPSGDGVLSSGNVAVGGGPLPGFGQLDAVAPVDLSAALAASGVTPAGQGYHVRLDVTGAGMKEGGAKSKTFWVAETAEPCRASSLPTDRERGVR